MSARCLSALRPLSRPSLVEDTQTAATAATGSLCVRGGQLRGHSQLGSNLRGFAEMCLLFYKKMQLRKCSLGQRRHYQRMRCSFSGPHLHLNQV